MKKILKVDNETKLYIPPDLDGGKKGKEEEQTQTLIIKK